MSNIINRSLITSEDAYKFSHPFMISRDVIGLTSYIEPRAIKHPELPNDTEIVFFGLQAYIRDYLMKPITVEDIDEAEKIAKSALIPFSRDMWEHIVTFYNGFLPVIIEALPEGSLVRPGVPVVQVTSLDTKYPGIISVIETSLLRAVWYPSTVATLSREIKKVIARYYDETSDLDVNTSLAVALNDFGARGVSSGESAMLGGMAHLVNFIGSDTIEAVMGAVKYYDHSLDRDGPVLISVPATEHSVTTMNGEDGESAFVGRIIDTFTEQGFPIVSIVADSYDLDRFVLDYIGGDWKEKIEARDGFIVVRPDSGEPTEIVPSVLRMLDEKFGSTVNSKGFKVLNPKVRIIQGDGVNYTSIVDILERVAFAGFSAENLVFGMGGQLLQAPMRDDFSWAMKTNAVKYRGQNWTDVQKKPKTDMSKASKAGRQIVLMTKEGFVARREDLFDKATMAQKNWLEPVWSAGTMIRTQTFSEIRKLAEI